MKQNPKPGDKHRWRFFRSGGFDQVALDNAEDLRHLHKLDPKLWSVLNCPTTGLEFDPRTAQLLDADGDGNIRVPEVLAAVHWALERLKHADVLFDNNGLPIDAIDDSTVEGARLRAAAIRVLASVGKTEADLLQVAHFEDMTQLFSESHFNGDGVVPVDLAEDEELKFLIENIIATQGAVEDRSGQPGITTDTLAAFHTEAEALLEWYAAGEINEAGSWPLGEAASHGATLFESLQNKVDDYFTRCKLAAFDERATAALNPSETVYQALGENAITVAEDKVAALPLAMIAAGQPLPLTRGVNPAWADQVAQFRDTVITPLLGKRDALLQDEWQTITARFAAWQKWQAARPQTALHSIEPERLRKLVTEDNRSRLTELIDLDLKSETSAANIDALERLVRYQRDLVTLLRNFVTLSDFYRGERKAIFQAGTLYLDQRSCELVMQVSDMTRHASMAAFSGCYLVYCNCIRQGQEPITIVAALTGGEVDELMVAGRNGVFYDRQGNDWKATVIKVIEQQVSLRQAFWSPYRRLGRFLENQLQKFAASRDQEVEAKTTARINDVTAGGDPSQTGSQAFDIARFAGIFAAIGLALGAIGTTLAAIMAGLFSLPAWQIPLVILGGILMISGPSTFMAYLTLRHRNLGPLLDANGWAVNTRARINLPFGAALTGLATLPTGSHRSLTDPYAQKQRTWRIWLILLLGLITLVIVWQQDLFSHLLSGNAELSGSPEHELPVPEEQD